MIYWNNEARKLSARPSVQLRALQVPLEVLGASRATLDGVLGMSQCQRSSRVTYRQAWASSLVQGDGFYVVCPFSASHAKHLLFIVFEPVSPHPTAAWHVVGHSRGVCVWVLLGG